MTGVGLLAEYILYTLILVAYSVVLSRVYNRAQGRLWPVVLLHAAITATGNTVLVALSPGRAGTWVPYIVYLLAASAAAAGMVHLTGTRGLPKMRLVERTPSTPAGPWPRV